MVHVRADIRDFPARDRRLAQMLAHDRHGPLPEFGTARDLHFDEETLAFMHCHAARPAERHMRPLWRQTLFIESVPGLMQDSHEGREEFRRDIACRHAHVAWHAAAEWVMRDIESAMGKIEAHGFHHCLAKRLLTLDRERRVETLLRMARKSLRL